MIKWHVFNTNNRILRYKGKILEFDTYDSAVNYLDLLILAKGKNAIGSVEIRQSDLYNIAEDKILNATIRKYTMKYYIYNFNLLPLYWDEAILEFDTYASAARFLVSAAANSEHLENFWDDAEIKAEILFDNDDIHLNATNMIVDWDNEYGNILVEVN